VTFRIPTARLPHLPTRGRRWLPIVAGLVVLIILISVYVRIETDYLWFQSVHFTTVFSRRLLTKVVLFFLFGGVMTLIVGANIVFAYRLRPPFRPSSPEQQQLEQLAGALRPIRIWLLALVLVLVWVFEGVAAAGRWRTWLLWRNGQHFGIKDPQFHKDVSYFAFTYPFQRWILGVLFAIVVVSLVAVLVTAYLYGGVRPQTPGAKVTPAARAHISVLLGVFVLLKAIAYWLDRYGVNFSRRGFVNTGASYTDVHAVLPAKTILVFVALICAGLFFANVRIRNWRLPVVALAVMFGSAIVIGGLFPLLVQQFSVRPSEADKEATYISRNIDATREAYGLEQGTSKGVQLVNYTGTATADPKSLRADSATLPNIRLLDPTVLPATYQQLQGFKSFYDFAKTLDVDRYSINGQEQEQVVAVRDINLGGLQAAQRSWINNHLVYTHGYGFVAGSSNAVNPDGTPVFTESNIPPTGSLASTFEPRIYFGENSPSYSIVGAPSNAQPRELDFPNDSTTGQANTTYTGDGGISIGSTWRKLLFALKFTDKNIFFSGGVNKDSRLMYVRNPRDRVAKVAPFLTLDSDPYPSIVDGHVVWIVDGYTTTDGFPYAARTSLSQATNDTLAQRQAQSRQPNGEVNYIRNSVKATVDAYTGAVHLYEWGQRDPVLATWMKAFPGIVQPESSIPTDLRAHLRYPEDLFKVQRTLLAKYHVTDAHAFYAGTDYWRVPDDPTKEPSSVPQPPYYLTLAMPGQTSPSFQLTTSLLQNNRPNMAAFVSVDSDPSSPDYGTMTVLQLPSNAQVNGPGQVANDFESFAPASKELSLFRRGGSRVTLGNLLSLPLGGAFLYVEPVYLQSAGLTSFPTLKRVLVSYDGNIAYEPTLAKGLDAVFGTATAKPPPTGPTTQPPPSTGGGVNAQVANLITQLQSAQADAEAALRSGDLTAYAEAEKRVASLIARLSAVSARR
jgi:uncharacterized protein